MGAPMVKVEITKEQLCDALDMAIRWFAAKKGVMRFLKLPINSGQTVYCLPDEVDTVIDVVFSVPPFDLSLIFSPFILEDDVVPYDVFAAPQSAGLYSSFVQNLQYVEQAKRILGAEPDWRQEDRNLHLFPIPKDASMALVEYKTNCFTLENLSERDHDLVKRYALAWTKRIVGRIRSKYESYPGAQGTINLDGAELKEEAREELEALEEEIFSSGMPAHFIVG